MSDIESDEAPEAVTFSASKTKALDEVRAANEAIQQAKEKRREAKKQRDELNK